MPAPIALQLYSVRDALSQDFEGVIRQVAAMGYVGVETYRGMKWAAAEAARLFEDLGLTVCGAHLPLPLGEQQAEVLDLAAALGTPSIVSPNIGRERYDSLDGVRWACDQFNAAHEVATAHGFRFGVHNHWWEFNRVDGRVAFDILRERLAQGVFFELDTYWAKTAGADPVSLVGELGARAPLLHIKDGPAQLGAPQVAVGQGSLDIPAIIAAGGDATEWAIVELDDCATDMLSAVRQSLEYLVGQGLARGKA